MRKRYQRIRPGERFGHLVVLRRSHRAKRHTYYLCRCDCGETTFAMAFKLTGGWKKSCGCLRVPADAGRRRSKVSWGKMIERCYDPTHKAYPNYGGRGITVCDRWRAAFELFYEDMGGRPAGLSLGRVDNERGYEPGNCRWETTLEQQDNRRITIWVTLFGRRETLRAACLRQGINYAVVHGRLKSGWTIEDAFSKPVRARSPNRVQQRWFRNRDGTPRRE